MANQPLQRKTPLFVASLALICFIEIAQAQLVIYPSRSTFNAAAPGAFLEDFETATIVEPATGAAFAGPLSATTDNGVFGPGDLPTGITFTSSCPGTEDLSAAGPGFDGGGWSGSGGFPSQVLMTTDAACELAVDFDPPVDAIALDVFAEGDSGYTVTLIGSDSTLLEWDGAALATTAGFFGVVSDLDIQRVELRSPIGLGAGVLEAVDNVEYRRTAHIFADGFESGSTDQWSSSTAHLMSIAVTPAEALLEIDLGSQSEQSFVATGWYSDGSSADLTAGASFTSSNPDLGTMSGPVLQIPIFLETFFGSTLVTAEVNGTSGSAQMTVVAHDLSTAEAELMVVLPFEDPGGPRLETSTFATEYSAVDVFINMDTTGSMGGPISNLQSSITSTVIPSIQAYLPDSQFGVGAFEDFPISPFGSNPCFVTGEPDQPFELLQTITDDTLAVQSAVSALSIGGNPIGCGTDYPESSIEGIFQIATGLGLTGPAPTSVAANSDGIGGVDFRSGALPVVLTISDAPSHNPGATLCSGGSDYDDNPSVLAVAATRGGTKAALRTICARTLAVAVSNFDQSCSAYSDGVDFANATGAVVNHIVWGSTPAERPSGCDLGQCCTGINSAGVAADGEGNCPLVYRANFDGTGVGTGMADGVIQLTRYSPLTAVPAVEGSATDIDGTPLPLPHTTTEFITAVTPVSYGEPPLAGLPSPVPTATTFEGVIPGTDLTFEIEAANEFIAQESAPQAFEATITLLADGCIGLDSLRILVVVPPTPLAGP